MTDDGSPNDFRAGPHAYRRAEEKFGLVLSRYDMEDIVRRIEEGDATPMGKSDRGGNRCYLVELRGKRVFAIFVPERRFIITFLTEEQWRDARARYHHNIAVSQKEKEWKNRRRSAQSRSGKPSTSPSFSERWQRAERPKK